MVLDSAGFVSIMRKSDFSWSTKGRKRDSSLHFVHEKSIGLNGSLGRIQTKRTLAEVLLISSFFNTAFKDSEKQSGMANYTNQ